MLSLPKVLPRLKQFKSAGRTSDPPTPSSPYPRMRTKVRRADYYLDASWHTRKSFRAIRDHANQTSDKLGPKTASESLVGQIDVLLWSIRPELPDDEQSKAMYLSLLSRQLQALDASTLEWLAPALEQAKYECHVTETIIDDQLYIEHGFSNGPPHTHQRTILTTSEFLHTIDQAREVVQTRHIDPDLALTDMTKQAIRNQLAINASQWTSGDRSLACLDQLAQSLASVLDTCIGAPLLTASTVLPDASTVTWRDGRLVIDGATAATLLHPGSDELFARVQRDILECVLLRRCASRPADTDHAMQVLRPALWAVMEQIESLPPSVIISAERRRALREAIALAEQPGSIQIMPTVGATLGHAWIKPHLSITPDKLGNANAVGTRFMHGGGQPQPKHSTINEWSIRWLTPQEMEECNPAQEAWHLEMPIGASQLASAAHSLAKEWKASGQHYRFAEVQPDKPASGCRISVWESVRRAMSPILLECFDEFNLGLPLPETPTALWERLRNFKYWVQRIAKD
ncbi:MAG: hypothetical protein RL618_268 [Pseudomonadota bacterium]